ncbi:MAG: PilZ domain-containing protein [Bdellovibrionota bacterium]
MSGKNKKHEVQDERRKAQRMSVQESFNLFLVMPSVHGMVRIYMRDISATGLCFRSEVENDLKQSQKVSARLYINPAFYLPLECEVVRVGKGEIAVQFLEPASPAAKAVAQLQAFFDSASDAGVSVE